MSDLIPKNLSIPVSEWYKQMRVAHTHDEVNGRTGKSRQKYISNDIIHPYLRLRKHLSDNGMQGVMMKDIVNVIINNPSIIEMLQKEEVAA